MSAEKAGLESESVSPVKAEVSKETHEMMTMMASSWFHASRR